MATLYQTSKGFGIDYRDENNHRRHIFIGSQSAATLAKVQIESEVRQHKAKLHSFERTATATLRDAFQTYNRRRDCEERTRMNEEFRIADLLRLHGSKLAFEVTPEILHEYFQWQRTLKAPSTVYQQFRVLRRFWLAMVEQNMVPFDATRGLAQAPPRTSRARALTPQEYQDVIACTTFRSHSKVLLAGDAGLRAGEIIILRKSNLNMKEHLIEFFRPKTRVMSVVPMTPRLHEALSDKIRRLQDPDALLFSRAGQMLRTRDFIDSVRRRSGVAFRFHDLRHTFATRVAQTGCRNRILQVLLGHTARTPSEIYDHPTLEELRSTIDAMDAATHNGEPKP